MQNVSVDEQMPVAQKAFSAEVNVAVPGSLPPPLIVKTWSGAASTWHRLPPPGAKLHLKGRSTGFSGLAA